MKKQENKTYKEKYETENRRNAFLFFAVLILALSLLVVSSKLEIKTEEAENLCYLNEELIDYANRVGKIIDIDVEIPKIQCDSGNAERRLVNEQ